MDLIGLVWNTIVYNPMLNALLLIYAVIRNYGVAIIVFTVLIASLTAPFRIKAQQAMKGQQDKMARVKPELDALKKKYKDNPQQFQAAQMKLYQENGLANPFNAGCLLTLLPFPIFIGLYNVILSVMGDRPEQMMQLAQHVYPQLAPFTSLIPVESHFLGLNLALSPSAQGIIVTVVMVGLVVGSSWIQQKMMTNPAAALDAQQASMNQQMQLITPLIFGFFVLNAPTGLSLYWVTFSVIGIVQQYVTTGGGGLNALLGRTAPSVTAKSKPASTASTSTGSAPLAPENGNENKAKAPAVRAGASSPSKGKNKRGKKH